MVVREKEGSLRMVGSSSSSSTSSAAMAVSSPFIPVRDQKCWWVSKRKIAEKHVRDAINLLATQEKKDVALALNLLDAALLLSPRLDHALELKAQSLLLLRRFGDVADMLQDYLPSLKIVDDNATSDESSQLLLAKHLNRDDPSFSSKCFSVSKLKKTVLTGLWKNCEEQQWRFAVLGQACCHLGLMEDAMILLQTGKRLASAAFRRESKRRSEDSFSFSGRQQTGFISSAGEIENLTNLLSHIKLLIRRRTAALAALDAGLYSEAIRHLTKIIDSRRGSPQIFLAECFMHRAAAYLSAGRNAESIADCNRTLALDSSSTQALETRASLFESIQCFPDCLHDLEHLKLLYNSILRDRKLAGPVWKRQNLPYAEIPGKLCALSSKIEELKRRISSEGTRNVDYYALMGLRRGCTRSELERAHLVLCLRHKPEKSATFIDRCELGSEKDYDSVRDRAKLSALFLYKLLQRGYSCVMVMIMEEEKAEKKRKEAMAAIRVQRMEMKSETPLIPRRNRKISSGIKSSDPSAFQGVFCRDLTIVGNLLSQVGFNRPISVKYEALSC